MDAGEGRGDPAWAQASRLAVVLVGTADNNTRFFICVYKLLSGLYVFYNVLYVFVGFMYVFICFFNVFLIGFLRWNIEGNVYCF